MGRMGKWLVPLGAVCLLVGALSACTVAAVDKVTEDPVIASATPMPSTTPVGALVGEPGSGLTDLSSGYPPVSFPVTTREPIPTGKAVRAGDNIKTTHIDRAMSVLGRSVRVLVDVQVPANGKVTCYRAKLRRQTTMEKLASSNAFFFGSGVALQQADASYVERYYPVGTVYQVTENHNQSLKLLAQDNGNAYSVVFANNAPWRYQVDTGDWDKAQSQCQRLLSLLFPGDSVAAQAHEIVRPNGMNDEPVATLAFAQCVDGWPISCGGGLPGFTATVATRDWNNAGYYGLDLRRGDVAALSASFLYDIGDSVGTVKILPLDGLLDRLEKDGTIGTMVSSGGAQALYGTARLVYAADRSQASQDGSFVLKPYWELVRMGSERQVFRFSADPADYE